MKSISEAAKKKGHNVVVNVGDIGYKFRKEFDSGWFTGTVKQIRPLAEGGKDRRCVYDDGDSEDLSLMQLQTLAIFDPNITHDDNAHAGNSGVVLGGTWEKRFAELKQYKKKFGDTRVPRNYSNRVLASWVKNQKNYYNRLMEGQDKAFITPEKICLLKSIGFVFRSNTRGRHVANNHHGVKSDETVTSKARGVKSDDTVTSKALKHMIQKRRRNLEVTELSQSETRSKRTVRQPPKADEIYSYEHMKFIYQRNKNKEAKDAKRDKDAKEAKETFFDPPHPGRKSHVTKSSMNPPTPPTPDRNLLSSLDYDIPVDAAAVSTLNFTDSMKHTVDMRYDSEDDEKEWLEKMAASLGADTSAPRQKQMSLTHAPILKQPSLKPTPNPQSCIMKSDAASTCSTISFTGIQKMGLNEGEMIQPPESVLITNVPSVSYSLLSEYNAGTRHNRFVIHKNDKRRRIGEVILENGEHWVEVSIGCALKKYHVNHLVVVPSKHSKVTGLPVFDTLCSTSMTSSSSKKLHFKTSSTEKRTPLIEKNTPPLFEINAPSSVEQLYPLIISDSEKSSENVLMPIEKKSVSISADHLFCWFCDGCDANNEVGASSCRECNASKTNKSKRSVLFDIAASAVTDEAKTVDEAITMVNEVMPTKLASIHQLEANDLEWANKSVEDSILCGENTAFPLGMKVRKFFTNYGFHDGRIIKIVRKIWAEKGLPILVYRCMYNDSDEEDFLHHEIVSLNQLYDKRNVSPEAPVHEQIPLGNIFETRSGHTVEIIGHKTPTGGCHNKGGLVTVKFDNSSKIIEFDLLELQKAVLRRVSRLQGNLDHIRQSAMSGVTDTFKHNHQSKSNGSDSKRCISSSSTDQAITSVEAEKDSTVTTPHVEWSNAPVSAPVLEWPMRCQQSKCYGESGIQSNDEQIEISRGFILHQRRHFASSDDQVLKFATSSSVNNPSDTRPGVSSERGMMWDPVSCYDYLVWDPYSAVVCEICAVNKDDNQVVICDECHKGFHTYCLRPVMVNIPRGDWWCSVCSGRTNDQVSYEEFKTNLSLCTTQDIFHFLGLPFDNPVEFFSRHSEAMGLFTLNSDAVVKQHAISHDVLTKSVVFGVDNIMFIRKPEKNDWRLPTPLLGEAYRLSTLSMAASMKYCGMESNLLELVYAEPANEGMNDPALEVDTVVPMSKRNLEIYRAFLHNIKQGVLPPVEIIHDENFGFSVKSLGFMRQHTLIGAYLGEVVTMEQSGLSSSDSLMVLLDTGNPQTSLIIDPTRAGNIARFLSGINNRSLLSRRKRNVRTRRFDMDGKMHVCLFTCRSVEAGEILNYDYNAGNEGKDIGQWTKTGFYDTSNFF